MTILNIPHVNWYVLFNQMINRRTVPAIRMSFGNSAVRRRSSSSLDAVAAEPAGTVFPRSSNTAAEISAAVMSNCKTVTMPSKIRLVVLAASLPKPPVTNNKPPSVSQAHPVSWMIWKMAGNCFAKYPSVGVLEKRDRPTKIPATAKIS